MDPFNRNPHTNVTHIHHQHHRRNSDEDEQQYPPPPGPPQPPFYTDSYPPPQPQPPFYTDSYPPPPPPRQPETQVFHSGHVSSDYNYSPPPPHHHHHHHNQPEPDHVNLNYGFPPAPTPTPPVPDYSTVHHVSHESHLPRFSNPSDSVVHVSHQHHGPSAPPLSNINKRTFRVITKADPNYALTIRRGEVVLARSDPSDQYQHWYKDEKFSTRVKDSEGYPAFSLVNKVTGEAIKHSIGASHPVRFLSPFHSQFT